MADRSLNRAAMGNLSTDFGRRPTVIFLTVYIYMSLQYYAAATYALTLINGLVNQSRDVQDCHKVSGLYLVHPRISGCI